MVQQKGDSKGKDNIESLSDKKTIKRFFELSDFQVGKTGF
jgi:hypothetical protein